MAYAKTKIDSVIFSRMTPGWIFKCAEMTDSEGEEMEDATGLAKTKRSSVAGSW
jgi:hypothetical protein